MRGGVGRRGVGRLLGLGWGGGGGRLTLGGGEGKQEFVCVWDGSVLESRRL